MDKKAKGPKEGSPVKVRKKRAGSGRKDSAKKGGSTKSTKSTKKVSPRRTSKKQPNKKISPKKDSDSPKMGNRRTSITSQAGAKGRKDGGSKEGSKEGSMKGMRMREGSIKDGSLKGMKFRKNSKTSEDSTKSTIKDKDTSMKADSPIKTIHEHEPSKPETSKGTKKMDAENAEAENAKGKTGESKKSKTGRHWPWEAIGNSKYNPGCNVMRMFGGRRRTSSDPEPPPALAREWDLPGSARKNLEIVAASEVTTIRSIGSGAFSEVFLSEFHGKLVVVKHYNNDLSDKTSVHQEADIAGHMMSIGVGPTILAFLETSQTPPYLPSLISEYLQDSESLEDVIAKINKFSVPEIVNIVSQIAHLVNRMHMARIIHNDIKSDNIILSAPTCSTAKNDVTYYTPNYFTDLIKTTDPSVGRKMLHGILSLLPCGNYTAHESAFNHTVALDTHLIDFGLASSIDELDVTLVVNKEEGSFTHLAPEVHEGKAVTLKSDTYSFGALVQTIIDEVKDPQLGLHLSELVKVCCHKNPVHRLNMNEVANIMYLTEKRLAG